MTDYFQRILSTSLFFGGTGWGGGVEEGIVSSFGKLCWIYIFLSRMSKLNASQIRETKAGAYFKDFKFMDLHRLLLKNSHDFMILLFFYLNWGQHDLQRWRLSVLFSWIKAVSMAFKIKVPLQGPTLGSHPSPCKGPT